MEVVYLTDLNRPSFEQDRLAVDVVCAGDSNHRLEQLRPGRVLALSDVSPFPSGVVRAAGLAGCRRWDCWGKSVTNGLGHVVRYLDLFPNSRYFIIGFGTNDLGMWPDPESTSRRIIENLGKMIQAVRDEERQPILFNVPYANESRFPPHIATDTHEKRNYHNGRLTEYCQQNRVPLADICSHLRDEHLGDELHPNEGGAKMIAEDVFKMLSRAYREA